MTGTAPTWMRVRKTGIAAMATSLVVGGLILAQGAPASAAAGNCNAKKDTVVKSWEPDDYRVIARCTHIAGGTQARGYLDMFGCCDKETSWFTTINKNYYSAYASGNYSGVGINLRDI